MKPWNVMEWIYLVSYKLLMCVSADRFVDDDLVLRPSRSTAALLPLRDYAEQPGAPPTSPMFSRSAGVRLGSAGLRRALAVVQQTTGGSHDHRPAEPTRPVAAGASETPRSIAARDALPPTLKDLATGTLSADDAKMSSDVKSSRRLKSADDISSLMTSAIHKVSIFWRMM